MVGHDRNIYVFYECLVKCFEMKQIDGREERRNKITLMGAKNVSTKPFPKMTTNVVAKRLWL
jgi:hypothetical protein